MHYRIQPAPITDHITGDGTELTKRPYPIVCDEHGTVEGMPSVAQVVGFVCDLARQEVDWSWHEVAARHLPAEDVAGMYVIVQDRSGNWSTISTAVESFTLLPPVGTVHAVPTKPVSLTPAEYRLGVHATHCCLLHGCKYGDRDCPVKTREVAQEYPCEKCPQEPVSSATADELLHAIRECVSALEGPLTALKDGSPVLAATLAGMRTAMDELDRKMTNGEPLPGDWNARR